MAVRENPRGERPVIDQSAYVDASAEIIGNVVIGRDVFVGPCAVLRADEPASRIEIGDNCNIQDRVIVHALKGSSVIVGKGSALSHGCIVHGPCEVGEGCFIGFGAVVFRSALAEKIFVGHLSLVAGVDVPFGRAVPGHNRIESPLEVSQLPPISEEQSQFIADVIKMNDRLVLEYRQMAGRTCS